MVDEQLTLKEITQKWQTKWDEAKLFEAIPDDRPKFFLNFPYPYINAYQHIGHLFTLMKVEAFARYKRMRGFNVLFPQGWHITGSPIVQAAKRVKEREPKQVKIMKDMGFGESDLAKFEEPTYWLEFFAPEFKKDYKLMGMSIDWRREFHTTDLNPHYDAFVKWQFRKLKEKGLVVKGKFPVVWDPKENVPVGDHDRVEGEGETPQEFMLIKHKLDDKFVISATLRQDTILGITNLYVHPELEYEEVESGDEHWILGSPAVERLLQQGHDLKRIKKVPGVDLIGKKTVEFGGNEVLILPATFLDPNFGTGLVHSVPSDSADDLIALQDLQKDEAIIKKYGLNLDEVRKIKPIAVLDTPGYSGIPAQDFLNKYNIKSQKERSKLDEIKKELYKLSHHSASFNEKYKDVFSTNLQGVKVEKGKDLIKKELIENGWATHYYQLTGKVVSRSLTECIVKIVDDQWFVDYGNEEWKQKARKCLDQIKLYPEKARQQFENVIDWLHEWACTRESGLGTRLPWDEKWLIESLSDSTIYMAYYTIVHILRDVPIEQVNDALFDYVLLDQEVQTKVDPSLAKAMRAEFDYWYPVDFRNSGKDLIQNHLTFFIFTHTAIFPEKNWPKGIGTNGWVTVDGQKMSKSLGNMIPVRGVAEEFGVDPARFTILFGGESLDDPNWESTLAKTLKTRLPQLLTFFAENYEIGRTTQEPIDEWFASVLNRSIRDATQAMDETLFRTALQKIYFDLGKLIRTYVARGDPQKQLLKEAIRAQVLMLTPFTPHICEEIWSELGHKKFISRESWPSFDESKINDTIEAAHDMLSDVQDDIKTVMQLSKIFAPKKITLFVADDWKFDFVSKLKGQLEQTNDMKTIVAALMATPLRNQGPQLMKLIPSILKDRSKLPLHTMTKQEELVHYKNFEQDISSQFNCPVEIIDANESNEQKARVAMPSKPAILIE